jgi:predicted TPR repeat methyltransferase
MDPSKLFDLVELNRGQRESELDSFTPVRYRQFARCIRPSSRVLDLGCNTGRGGQVLRDLRPGIQLFGFDIVADRLRRIPEGVYDGLYSGTISDLVDTKAKVDFITMGEVIEHIPYSQLDAFLESLYALLDLNGQIALTTPNPHYLFLRWRGGSALGGSHVSVHCPSTLREVLHAHGLEVTAIRGTGRISRFVGRHFPLCLYSSFLMVARRAPRISIAEK